MAKKEKESKSFIPAVAIADNLIFTRKAVWAYYRIGMVSFDFLSTTAKVSMANAITNAFAQLMSDKTTTEIPMHIVSTSFPVDVNAWDAQVQKFSQDWNHSPGYEDFINSHYNQILREDFVTHRTFLGIQLFKRGELATDFVNPLEQGWEESKRQFKNWAKSALSIPGADISQEEEEQARAKEHDYFTTLYNGNLSADRCTAEELLLLMKRQMYPAMPTPYLEIDQTNRVGAGDILAETSCVIENNYRYLKMSQLFPYDESGQDMEVDGYRAVVSFVKFPKYMSYPNGSFPFMYLPSKMGYPFTVWARFTLMPSDKMKKQLDKKKKDAKDELKNMAGTKDNVDQAVDPDIEVSDSLADLNTMAVILSQDKTPWVKGSYFITLQAPTKERLLEYASNLRQAFADAEIKTLLTAGDQFTRFVEEFPGAEATDTSFDQLTSLSMISTSGMNFGSNVGDEPWDVVRKLEN